MKNTQHTMSFSKTLVALAVLAACTPTWADTDIGALAKPQSSVTVGVAASSGGSAADTSLADQYSDLRGNRATVLLEVDVNKRDDATGTTLSLQGTPYDIGVSYEKQGDWKVGASYSNIEHREIRTANTAMQGVGSTTPSVVLMSAPGTGQDVNLKLKRVGMGLTAEKWLSNNLQMELALRNEDKTGARTWGIGYDCAAYVCSGTQSATAQKWALLYVPEPVNSTTRQLEAKINYAFQGLNVSAGYYGSFYTNAYGSLRTTVPNALNNPLGVPSTLFPAAASTVIAGGGTSLQNVLQLPVALPPDNQAHQYYVSGSYRFTPTTNATFKYAYTHATQNEDFAAMGLTGGPAGVTSLGGVVDTTLVQLGLTSRPMKGLSLLANVRYEDKKDKTPEYLYNVEPVTATPATVPPYTNGYWLNNSNTATKLTGKLEASYQFLPGTRATVGVDHHAHERPVPVSIAEEKVAGLGALRARNEETGYRFELRRSMSESFSGALGYQKSKRTGSDWTSLSTSAVFAAAGLGYGKTGTAAQFLALNAGNAFPMNMVDVDREKIKLSANWAPSEQFDLTLSADHGKDSSAMPFNAVALDKSWRESALNNVALDATWAVSDKWRVNGFAALGEQGYKINHSTGYRADLNTQTISYGLGLAGKLSGQMEVGMQGQYVSDITQYGLDASTTVVGTLPNITAGAPSATNLAQAAMGLPNVRFESTALTLYGKMALDKNADLKISLVYMRQRLNEWSWGYNGKSFVFQDNTSLGFTPSQGATYLSIGYLYRF